MKVYINLADLKENDANSWILGHFLLEMAKKNINSFNPNEKHDPVTIPDPNNPKKKIKVEVILSHKIVKRKRKSNETENRYEIREPKVWGRGIRDRNVGIYKILGTLAHKKDGSAIVKQKKRLIKEAVRAKQADWAEKLAKEEFDRTSQVPYMHAKSFLTYEQDEAIINAFIMRELEGVPLSKIKEVKKFSAEEFINLSIDLFRAIRPLHKEELSHSDLHSGNVIFNPENGKVRLIDFEAIGRFSLDNDFNQIQALLKNIKEQSLIKNNIEEENFLNDMLKQLEGNTTCALVFKKSFSKEDIKDIPKVAYILTTDGLFYVDKRQNKFDPIPLTPVEYKKLYSELSIPPYIEIEKCNEAKIFYENMHSNHQNKIKEITNHEGAKFWTVDNYIDYLENKKLEFRLKALPKGEITEGVANANHEARLLRNKLNVFFTSDEFSKADNKNLESTNLKSLESVLSEFKDLISLHLAKIPQEENAIKEFIDVLKIDVFKDLKNKNHIIDKVDDILNQYKKNMAELKNLSDEINKFKFSIQKSKSDSEREFIYQLQNKIDELTKTIQNLEKKFLKYNTSIDDIAAYVERLAQETNHISTKFNEFFLPLKKSSAIFDNDNIKRLIALQNRMEKIDWTKLPLSDPNKVPTGIQNIINILKNVDKDTVERKMFILKNYFLQSGKHRLSLFNTFTGRDKNVNEIYGICKNFTDLNTFLQDMEKRLDNIDKILGSKKQLSPNT